MDYHLIRAWVLDHRGKLLGALAGLFFSLSVIYWGFFKTLFIIIFVTIGYLVGKQLDDQVDFKDMLARFFRER